MRAALSRRVRVALAALMALCLGGWLLVETGAALGLVRAAVAWRFDDVPRMGPAALAERIGRAETVRLLDARTPEEYAVSHLRGAVRVDPDAPRWAPVPAGTTVVVYCAVGYRSAKVARALRARGLREVFNLDGGVFAWVADGRAVERAGRRVAEVHPYDRAWGLLLRGARAP